MLYPAAEVISFTSYATPLTHQLFSNGGTTRRSQPLLSHFLCTLPSLSSIYPFPSLLLQHRRAPISCSSSSHGIPTTTTTTTTTAKSLLRKTPLFSEGRDEDEARLICPGCGVFMQDSDPNFPGFYQKPTAPAKLNDVDDDEEDISSEVFSDEDEERIDGSVSKLDLDSEMKDISDESSMEDFDWDSEWDDIEEDEAEKLKEELDGFTLAGVGYGNNTEEIVKQRKREKVSKSEKKRMVREAKRTENEEPVTVCARCHSLRNYGLVKNQKAENLIPDFDFDRFISTRLMRPGVTAPVVIMVVDCSDFDGSFPRRAVKSLFKALEGSKNNVKSTRLPKLVLVGTKADLLPSQISPTRLDRWVRNRAKSAGAPKLNAVYLVSARKDLGVRNLLSFIKELAGPRGNVWVIGAQNAGKSTLINAFAKKEGAKITRLTEAAVPGTTLGILRITGILTAKAKLYDTPGLLHPYLMSMRLNREEQMMVEIRKELQPRTYRVKVGQTIQVGGLMRLDLIHASVQTIYITIWASPSVSLHMGKTENAEDTRNKHIGIRLQPPIGQDRVSELGDWKERKIKVSGVSWDVNCIDIAASGLGWFSLGLKGEATVALWTFDGIDITEREPLVLDRAPFLERPGFWLPKAISDAIGKQSSVEAETKKKKEERMESLWNASI